MSADRSQTPAQTVADRPVVDEPATVAQFVQKTWEKNRLLSVLIELTYQCNLSCWFCYNDVNRKDEQLSLDDHLQLLEDLAAMQVFHLVLTGGEPMAHPHFWEIGRKAKDLGFVVRLKTNGHLLTRAVADRLFEEVDPFLVEISLHGIDAETHERQTRVPGSFDRLMENLRHGTDAGLRIKINTTLTRWNEDQIESMMALTDSLGLPLQVDPVVTVRDDGDASPLSIAASDEGLENLLRLQRRRAEAAAQGQALAMEVGRDADRFMPQADSMATSTAVKTKHCGAGSGGLAIDPFGNVYPCVQWRVPVGNVRQTRIHDMWSGSKALQDVRKQNQDIHSKVESLGFWGQALGFCPGAAAVETGDAGQIYDAARRRADTTVRLADERRELLPIIKG